MRVLTWHRSAMMHIKLMAEVYLMPMRHSESFQNSLGNFTEHETVARVARFRLVSC